MPEQRKSEAAPRARAASTRGAAKLRAAVGLFRLGGAIAGARCIDVGASTGGFTAVLLEHGAARVTAVDVGRGQIDPALRHDGRVDVLEGVHFKNLPLAVAEGPYDFFTVDVSFITARSMLRSLAFRLRPGAMGMILVKPQFELPKGRARGAALRGKEAGQERALQLVREKATRLGFVLVGHAPSPVPGGEGTIELLTCWRFDGRTDSLPARKEAPPAASPGSAAGSTAGSASPAGERTERSGTAHPLGGSTRSATIGLPREGAADRREARVPGRGAGSRRWTLFAVTSPGLEAVVERELRNLGVLNVRRVEGGVEFDGTDETIWRANVWLRAASRVLVRLGEVTARDFSKLRRGLSRLPWDLVTTDPRIVTVKATAHRSRLYHTGAIEENVRLALRDAFGKEAAQEDGDEELGLTVFVRGVEDRFTVSVDTSGRLLHRRGWRQEAGEAPLRETLAAGMLLLAGWGGDTPLLDPCCGSGTIVLEAALLAEGRAPGAMRPFAFERFPGFDEAACTAVRAERRPRHRGSPPPLLGHDADPEAVALAERNALRAGVADVVRFEARPLELATPPADAPPGLLICNPPYGRRLGTRTQAASLLGVLGEALRTRFRGWRAAVLAEHRDTARLVGMRPSAVFRLVSGGRRVGLHLFEP